MNDMEENIFSLFLGSIITIAIIFLWFNPKDWGITEMERLAIEKGHAHYEVNEQAEVSFMWNENCRTIYACDVGTPGN